MAYEALFQQARDLNTPQGKLPFTQKAAQLAVQGEHDAQTAAQKNAAVQSPDLAKAYMGAALLATKANAAVEASNQSQAKIADAANASQQATLDVQGVDNANLNVQAVHGQATADLVPIDENNVLITPANHHGEVETFRNSANATAAAAVAMGPTSVQTANTVKTSQTAVEDSRKNAELACKEMEAAQRSGAALNPNLPGLSVGQQQLLLAAQQAAANPAVTNGIDNTRLASAKPVDPLAANVAALKQQAASNVQLLQGIADQAAKPLAVTPITAAISHKDLTKAINAASGLTDAASQNANAVEANANAMAQTAAALVVHNNALLNPVTALGIRAAAVVASAQAASQAIPYNSNSNAADAKDCIDAAKSATVKSAEADAVLAPADQTILQLTAALADLRAQHADVQAADKAKRNSDETPVFQKVTALKTGFSRLVGEAQVAGNPADGAIAAAMAAMNPSPSQIQQCQPASESALGKKIRSQKKRLEEAKLELLGLIQRPRNPKIASLAQQIADGDILLLQAQQARTALAQAIGPDVARAQAAALTANQDKAQAIGKRMAQLSAEGHGPQRHEGQVTPADLQQRAVYKIDPESHTQVDAEDGTKHSAESVASKFNNEEAYVMAESATRAALLAGNPAGQHAEQLVPLATLGQENQLASGVESTWKQPAQPTFKTSLGPALRIPTQQPWVDGSPPPVQAEWDAAAMQAEIAAHSVPVDFTGGQAKAIYRKDINGNWYLRSMWSQTRP